MSNQPLSSSMNVQWRRSSTTMFYVLSVLSLGILPVISYFFPIFRARLRSKECSPSLADFAIITLPNGSTHISAAFHHNNANELIVSLEVNAQRFCASSLDKFQLVRVPQVPRHFQRFLKQSGRAPPSSPLSLTQKQFASMLEEERSLLYAQYGNNKMTIPETSPIEILIRIAFSPFFLFQYFATGIWMFENYVAYSILILIITLSSIYITTKEELYNLERLRTLAGVEANVQFIDQNFDGEEGYNGANNAVVTNVPDSVLLPGDRFLVVEGVPMPCDAILISGRVIVDESMLTGESIPVGKTPIELVGLGGVANTVMVKGSIISDKQFHHELYPKSRHQSSQYKDVQGKGGNNNNNGGGEQQDDEEDSEEIDLVLKRSGSVLFGGTKVKACHGGECIAVCYRTGFRSAKGQLVASLLNPKEGFLSFFSDALYVILFLIVLTTAMYGYVAWKLFLLHTSFWSLILRYCDAITIAVPPALTTSLSIATAISIDRLKKLNIFISDTSRVNWAGAIGAACFDKTGTLTEERLNFQGASVSATVAASSSSSSTSSNPPTSVSLVDFPADSILTFPSIVIELMATCHSLSLLPGSARSNTPQGDPLEAALFCASGWMLETSFAGGSMSARPPNSFDSYDIIRHYEFTPEKLRSATLLRRPPTSRTANLMKNSSPQQQQQHQQNQQQQQQQQQQHQQHQQYVYLIKGSPEAIANMSDPTTVPQDLNFRLKELAKRGLRVIAMAYRECSENADFLEKCTQDQLESLGKIHFLGLLYLSSKLKNETRSTISTLKAADIQVNMITGDHIHTAIAVATDCGILSPAGVNTNVLYLVDGDENTGKTLIMDGFTDEVIDMDLESLLNLTAATSLMPPARGEPVTNTSASNHVVATSSVSPSSPGYAVDAIAAQSQAVLVASLPLSPKASHVHSHVGPVQIAVTGRGLASVKRNYDQVTVNSLVRYAKVFARTKPADKKYVVEELMHTLEVDERLQALMMRHEGVPGRSGSVVASESTNLLRQGGGGGREGGRGGSLKGSEKHSPSKESNVTVVPVPVQEVLIDNDDEEEEDRGQFHVLFCGDGANDMTALRAATVGVSLCDAETSVAAPITSKLQTPGSVIEVLREGRCSLITAYVLVLFNIQYGVIQLFMSCKLYGYGLIPGDYMTFIQDLFYTLILGLAIAFAPASTELSSSVPPRRFFCKFIMAKLVLQVICFIFFQVASLQLLAMQPFYTKFVPDVPFTTSYSYEATTIDDMALAQLMIASVVSSIGEPFRKPWYLNKYHVCSLIFQLGWLLFQVFGGDNWFSTQFLSLKPLPFNYGLKLCGLMLLNAIVSGLLAMIADRLRTEPKRIRMQKKLIAHATRQSFSTSASSSSLGGKGNFQTWRGDSDDDDDDDDYEVVDEGKGLLTKKR